MARRRVNLGGGREMLDSMRNTELRAFLDRADQRGLQVAALVRVRHPLRPGSREAHLRAFNPGNFKTDADAITDGDIRELVADTLADAHAYLPGGFVVIGIQLYSGDTGELAPYSGQARAS